MIDIDNVFFSFESNEIKGFERIRDLAIEQSFFPESSNNYQFIDMTPDDSLWKLKKSLDALPAEETMLQIESRQAAKKYKKRICEVMDLRNARKDAKNKVSKYVNEENSSKTELFEGVIKLKTKCLEELKKEVSVFFGQKCLIKGNFLYPKGGFRSWHTNKYDTPGWRMYIVNVDNPNQSFFRFKHPKNHEIYTHWEQSSCSVNFFRIDPENILWHCIASLNTNRWSKGFLVSEDWMKKVL